MDQGKTIGLDSHALATLRYIRSSIDRASVLELPGSAGFALGAIGCAATALTLLPAMQSRWFPIWVAAAFPAVVAGGALLLRRSSLRQLATAQLPLRNFFLCLFPGLALGAVVTAVLWTAGLEHSIRPVWLLAYGCALVSASVVSTSTLAIMGCSFAGLGIVAFMTSDGVQALLMGAGFGVLHLLFARLIAMESRRGRKG